MSLVEVAEAEASFSSLLEQVASGEVIVLVKNGKPLAEAVGVGKAESTES